MALSRAEPKTANRLAGRVAQAGYLGDRILYVIEAEGRLLKVARPAGGEAFGIGEPIWVSWPATAAMRLKP
jgi:hypothetical protein